MRKIQLSTPVRERIIDLAAISFSVLVVLSATIDASYPGEMSGERLFWSVLLGCLGCLALWWRRRWPTRVAVFLVFSSALTEFVGGAVLVALYTVAVRGSGRVAVSLTVAHILAVVPFAQLQPDPAVTLRDSLPLTVVLAAVTLGLGRRTRTRRRVLESMHDRLERTEAEARMREERIRFVERERISREIHDALAHHISLISLHAAALSVRTDLTPEQITTTGETIHQGAHEALQELREILGVLRGGDGEPVRSAAGLGDIAKLVEESTAAGTPVELDDRLPDSVAPASAGRTAYRIVQEGLTNARKHAFGATVQLRLEREGDELHIWIRNPLVAGRPTVPGSRTGLIGLTERIRLAGGRLDHGARQGPDGVVEFHLEAWIPWPK